MYGFFGWDSFKKELDKGYLILIVILFYHNHFFGLGALVCILYVFVESQALECYISYMEFGDMGQGKCLIYLFADKSNAFSFLFSAKKVIKTLTE